MTTDRRRWLALAVVCLAQLMIVLDTTIVNVALPYIQRDLHFTQGNLTWVVNAFLVTFGSFLLLAGRLGDLLGRKRVFLAGVMLFTLASLLCGAADSSTTLVVARFIQGVGAALQASVILAIIVTEFPTPTERARAMSAYVFTAVAGGSLGLLAGGALTQLLDWHWIFFVNLPIGLLAVIAGRMLIPDDTGIGIEHGVDWLGSILSTLAIGVAVYAIVEATTNGWGSTQTLGGGAVAVALLAAFIALESRLENPIMPLRILKLRGLVVTCITRGFLVTGMYGTWFIGSLYLEHILHYDAIKTGLAFMPWTLTVAVLSMGVTRRLVARLGAMPVMVGGLVLVAVGLYVMHGISLHTDYFPRLLIGFFLMGLGVGNAFMPMLQIAMEDVPPADAGLGSGIVNVSQQVSGALGLAILSTFATNHTSSLLAAHHALVPSLLSGYRLAYVLGIGSVLIGVVVAVALLGFSSAPGAAVAADAVAAGRSEVAVEPVGGDTPRIVRRRSEDEDLGGGVAEEPGEVLLA
ncbi:MAG: MFS transporter [Acidobacteriota bacterium]|nr:MFS transporter [Acidobacteriota bacterium]